MDRWSESVFQSAALASGLVTKDQIDEAVAALRAGESSSAATQTIDDQALADKLIELKWINPWQATQLKEGRTKFNLGDYRIIDSIGQGGMGQVFKSEHILLGRVEAIKVLPRTKSTPEAIASFRREIRAQAQLDHPNLVRALYAGQDGNVYYLVTEFVPGTDLRRLVRSGEPLTMQQAATIISQAAKGLAYAHNQGLIHRDVKPGNLLVAPDGTTKVSDLGLAALLSDVEEDPRAGKVVGTADYLAPEQILTPRDITPAADIYSLGCTLYYAVTGKVPFPGGSAKDKARRHCEDPPLHPRNFNPALTDEFVDVIADMMEKHPADRVPSAQAVIERLSGWTTGERIALPTSDKLPPADVEELRETDSDVFEFPNSASGKEDSASQASQGTDAPAAVNEDTVPEMTPSKSKVPPLPKRAGPPALTAKRPTADATSATAAPSDESVQVGEGAAEQDAPRPKPTLISRLPKIRLPKVRLPKVRLPRIRLPRIHVPLWLLIAIGSAMAIAAIVIWALFAALY